MNRQELIDYINSLPPLPYSPSNSWTWIDRRIQIREAILNDNLNNIPHWPVIHSSMSTPYTLQYEHIGIWQQYTGLDITTLNSIVEFGGGYGAMLKCLRKLGFKGNYYGYDFPELLAIQRYYTFEDFSQPANGEYDLLISICAISESSLFDRQVFLDGKRFKHILIRYQATWDGIDNHKYFSSWKGDKMNVKGQSYNDHWYLIR